MCNAENPPCTKTERHSFDLYIFRVKTQSYCDESKVDRVYYLLLHHSSEVFERRVRGSWLAHAETAADS